MSLLCQIACKIIAKPVRNQQQFSVWWQWQKTVNDISQLGLSLCTTWWDVLIRRWPWEEHIYILFQYLYMQNGETPLSSKEKSSFTKSKIRKPGKKLKGSLPPTPNNLITSHFKPIASSSSDVPDETEINVQRGVGEEESVLCILSRSLVTRPPS